MTSIKFRLRNFHLGYSNDKSKRFSSKTPEINPNKLLLNSLQPLNNNLWFKFASYKSPLPYRFLSLLLLKKTTRSNDVLISNYGIPLLNNIKFIYSEKATKFFEIFPLLLTVCNVVKSKGKISQNFVAFSEYMNFNN